MEERELIPFSKTTTRSFVYERWIAALNHDRSTHPNNPSRMTTVTTIMRAFFIRNLKLLRAGCRRKVTCFSLLACIQVRVDQDRKVLAYLKLPGWHKVLLPLSLALSIAAESSADSNSAPPPAAKCGANTPALVFILDTSNSVNRLDNFDRMRKAVPNVIRQLDDEFYVAAIRFAEQASLLLPPAYVKEVRERAAESFENIVSSPRSNLTAALSFAKTQLENCPATRKHFILLSDGATDECISDMIEDLNKLKSMGITISTIAVDYDGEGGCLQEFAAAAGGRFWNSGSKLASLEKQILRDIQAYRSEARGSPQTPSDSTLMPSGSSQVQR